MLYLQNARNAPTTTYSFRLPPTMMSHPSRTLQPLTPSLIRAHPLLVVHLLDPVETPLL